MEGCWLSRFQVPADGLLVGAQCEDDSGGCTSEQTGRPVFSMGRIR